MGLHMCRCTICNFESNNKGAFAKHERGCIKFEEVKDELVSRYKDGDTLRKLAEEYKIPREQFKKHLIELGIFRAAGAAQSLSQKRNPRKLSEQHKQKIREARLKWMKENPEKTAWRLRKEASYPSRLFVNICKELSLFDKYDIVQEYSMFPFFIDFAFTNIKVAVEVDGSQHWKDPNTIQRDIRKEELLSEKGWRLMRIPEFKLKDSYDDVIKDLQIFLESFEIKEKKYDNDIIHYEQLRKKKEHEKKIERDIKNRRRIAEHNARLAYRKIDFEEVYPAFGWSVTLGNKWGMSSQAASRYCRKHFDMLRN